MADFNSRFKSARQDWTTPLSLFEPLNEEFQFSLDAAASAENALAEKFFTEEDDGLQQCWGGHVVWCNPPYGSKSSKTKDWVIKAYNESVRCGATVVMLIPARTNTAWFQDYCLAKAEVRFVRGRPKFGDSKHGLPLPLAIVVFRSP